MEGLRVQMVLSDTLSLLWQYSVNPYSGASPIYPALISTIVLSLV